MSRTVRDDASDLIASAFAVYQDDPAATKVLQDLDRRLREPLRLALAGMVKAGKSTLLNAMLGEQIAPTDAGECTRVVTWYRYSATPYVTLHPREGEPRRMPVKRERGKLVLTLDGIPPEDVKFIDVGWPSSGLQSVILIDTPGIASLSQETSARSTTFLTPDESPSSADAIVYLLRHLHASDVKFLEAFRDTAAGVSQTVNAVGVLSRADEVGSGRIDSLLSASRVARRYERDGDLGSLALGVTPVAGLLAEGARTLREKEFAAFRELARLDKASRDRLLVSADRFVRPTDVTTVSQDARRDLLGRFGIFGVRLATTLVRGGASDSSQLAERLIQQSGLNELNQVVRNQFRTRADALKVRGVLDGLDKLVHDHPRAETGDLVAGIERIYATAHTLRELSLLARMRASGLPLSKENTVLAERLVGGKGTPITSRLAAEEGAGPSALRQLIDDQLIHWRTLAQSPLTERATTEVCRVVIRSLEEMASELGTAGFSEGTAADVDATGGPGEGGGHRADEESEQRQTELDDQELTEELAVAPAGDKLQR
ncbi:MULTISPECIES: dynamin family protein [unclassified Microbacterium]|uniref:dynamin family protein n=1 Tax=unclassified Microbacterium TaxID=2609290 RepID=UPI00214C6596|nr:MULTISPECIES: dynamin family protein [unclassified Microbacterium]MCR2808961.1 dynamin family protein [Microbacterium sp. zg.B185]WIM18623.1 dynamin family protein [Microbacterium sp. zg-B185]